jgi:hypothetical protein
MSTVEIPRGAAVCGCAGCDEIFTCLSAFDRHQTLGPDGLVCHAPAKRGLVVYEKTTHGEVWGMWGWPPSAESIWDDR